MSSHPLDGPRQGSGAIARKPKARSSFAVFSGLLLLCWTAGCTRSDLGASGPVPTDGGLEFKTIATLGEEGLESGDLVFGHIADLEVDFEDRILVADSKMKSLRLLAMDGETLWSLDTQGQGPGEVRKPWLVTTLDDQVFMFDIGKRRVMVVGLADAEPEYEIIVPYFLYGLAAEKEGGFFAAGVVDADFAVAEQRVLHHFGRGGDVLVSYPVERPFRTEGFPSRIAKQIIYQYYAGRAAIEALDGNLLVSPVFDRSSYLLSPTGETLRRYENRRFDVPLLSYEVSEVGATFNTFESVSGPALAMPDGRILKGYQIAREETLQFKVDLFAPDGTLLAHQISVPGMPKAIGADGLIYAVKNLPYPQIFVLEMVGLEDRELVQAFLEGDEQGGHS